MLIILKHFLLVFFDRLARFFALGLGHRLDRLDDGLVFALAAADLVDDLADAL